MFKDNYTIVSPVSATQETIDWLDEHYYDLIGVKKPEGPATPVENPEELEEAIAEGGNVELTADMVMSAPLAIEKDTKIDLGGHDLDFTGVNGYGIVNDGNLTISGEGEIKSKGRAIQNKGNMTIEGGTFESTNDVLMDLTEGAKLTIEGGTFKAQECAVLVPNKNSEVVINDGEFVCKDNACIMGNGNKGNNGNKIIINGGIFTGAIESNGYVACGVYVPNDDIVEINGGTFNITKGCGICQRAGVVTVNGGTFNTTGDATGKVGDSRVVVPCSAVVFDSEAKYPALNDNAKIIIKSGAVLNSENGQAVVWIQGDDTIQRIFDER